jgi:antitoxin ParD1/3/4
MATTTMNISLPETMKAFIDERLGGDGYGTASEYVRELIRADQKRREEQKLEKLLLDRLQSGTEIEFDIENVRAELSKRLGKKK